MKSRSAMLPLSPRFAKSSNLNGIYEEQTPWGEVWGHDGGTGNDVFVLKQNMDISGVNLAILQEINASNLT
ncbi:MAG: hypothetical protein IGS23_02670 [Rivularia sp. T60_A2020_040]|nr:hypothetical protein [Rivularia sp. T60_A2020_040]